MCYIEKMGDKYDLSEFAFAADVVKDFPKILDAFDVMQRMLQPYEQYRGVWHAVRSIEEARTTMLMQLDYYKVVHKNRGKTSK